MFAIFVVAISVALPGFTIPVYKFFFPQNKIVLLRAVVALNWRQITTEDLTLMYKFNVWTFQALSMQLVQSNQISYSV